ncbi:MAG: ferrous iron transport protein B [Pirellulaceae bacterium]|nr:MAG: ferrous iron transport protein B [Pirellulaceae bacterium]
MDLASPDTTPPSLLTTELTVALIGNPNTGKSTLFSALSGIAARIGNYPGVTVEKKVGRYADDAGPVTLIDLPGTYSMAARSADEKVAIDVLLGRLPDVPSPDVLVVIVDATNLDRNLYLFTQIRELGKPTVLALNMWDRVEASGIQIDVQELSRRLGVPVVPCAASRRVGISELRRVIREVTTSSAPPCILGEVFEKQVDKLAGWIQEHCPHLPTDRFVLRRLILDVQGAIEREYCVQAGKDGDALEGAVARAREELAQHGLQVPLVETRLRYQWIRQQLDGIYEIKETGERTWSDRIDHVLTHRFWGFLAFLGVMFLVFQGITWGASWAMDWITDVAQPACVAAVESLLAPGMLRSLLTDGVIAGVGSVVVFLPQILVLFLFIAMLEDCGYMARAAFVMDKLMTKVGLSGKSFLPLMSSFACAVPGIMATRVIDDWRDRMVTILVAPLMSCSARLPVYVLLTYTFVPDRYLAGGWISLQGLVLFAMHLVGAAVAIPVAWALKRFVFPGQTSAFVMELPSYKLPSARVVASRVLERGQAFLTRAGTLIFCTSILVWAAGYFPGDHSRLYQLTAELEAVEQSDAGKDALEPWQRAIRQESGRLIRESVLGRTGQAIEPIVRPLGWDWRIGVGVLASFPAREVIIATLGTIYSLGGDVDEEDPGLRAAIRQATWPDGTPVYNLPVAFSIMVFFALCAQCAATLMVIRRETNSWRWPVFAFVYMTMLAYLGALVTYQVGMWWYR